ncbi:hypothetical protein Tco_1560710 [Tanacetum coccineum]
MDDYEPLRSDFGAYLVNLNASMHVFGMPKDRMKDILNAQTKTTILPSVAVSPRGGDEEIPEGGGDRQAGGDD